MEPSDEKLAQFQSITGWLYPYPLTMKGLPVEEAWQFLTEARWDLEVFAVVVHIQTI